MMKEVRLNGKYATSDMSLFFDDYEQMAIVLVTLGHKPRNPEVYLKRRVYPLFFKAWKDGLFKIQL